MPRAKKPIAPAKTNPKITNQGEEVYDAHARETVHNLLSPDSIEPAPAPVIMPDEFTDLKLGKTVVINRDVPDSPLFPHLTIVIVTYKRYKEIQLTIDALLDHLVYPREKLHWLIADDSSGGEYVANIKRIQRYKDLDLQFSVTPQNGGWSKNVNQALAQVETDLFFFIEDDYRLVKPLDLRVGVALLETKKHIGMLRYRGTAGSHVVMHQMECDVSAYLPHYQDGLGVEGKLTYCLLDSGSPDLYLYTHGASLRHKTFGQFYGAYPEGLKLGATEERYAHIVKDGMKTPNAPAIAILPEWIPMLFDHIGESRQHTEFDKGSE